MNNLFDPIIDRTNSDSLKYDFARKRGKPEDILPLWVADMDFKAPDCVIHAIAEKSAHGIFGYSESRQDYFDAVRDWFLRNHSFRVEPEWLIKTPGVVFAICAAIRSLTIRGDAVLIQQPVYYPFMEAVLKNERELVVNRLVYRNGEYSINFEDFEKQIVEHQVKLFILCSPHNPAGRVWTKEELLAIGEICIRHNVLIISDEIHSDFVYPGHRHLVFSGLNPAFQERTITCTAPTKTFNLAGLQISNIFIPNSAIRKKIMDEMTKSGYSQVNVMGITACRAAYTGGQPWLDGLKKYLLSNLSFLRDFLRERLPQIQLVEPQGTYLVWLDFQGLGLSDKQLNDFLVHKARLWLDAGSMFGAGGEGFQRINIACPRSTLEKALLQLERAVQELSAKG